MLWSALMPPKKGTTTGSKMGPGRKKQRQSKIPSSVGKNLLKPIDKKILNIIMGNGRMSNIEIAKLTDSSEATVRRRIQHLVESEVIEGFSISVNYDKLGVSFIRVLLFLEVETDYIQDVADKLCIKKELYYLHQIVSSRYNLIGGLVFPNLENMQQFFDELQDNKKVLRSEYNIITEDYVSFPCGMILK